MSREVEIINELPVSLAVVRQRSVLLTPVMDVGTALTRLEVLHEFVAKYLSESSDGGQDGGDYGVIPGAGKKKILLKSGADKLGEIYGLYDEYLDMTVIENWETGLFFYRLKCILKSRVDDSIVGSGVGSCSSFESKYRWRDAQRKCPKCEQPAIIKGKEEYGGGWLCFAKKGGCGAKFKAGDESIEKQVIGRVENPDIIDAANTVLKMAKKRAKVDAIIGVTRSSGIFTQDEEIIEARNIPTKEPEVTDQQRTFQRNPNIGQGPVALVPKSPGFPEPEPPDQHSESAGELIVKGSPSGNGAVDRGPVADSESEFISIEDAQLLHIHFRDFLTKPLKKKADALLEEWCRGRKLVDTDGKGTTKKIRARYAGGSPGFDRAKNALEIHANDLNAKATESK